MSTQLVVVVQYEVADDATSDQGRAAIQQVLETVRAVESVKLVRAWAGVREAAELVIAAVDSAENG